jgi:hypothetical protein
MNFAGVTGQVPEPSIAALMVLGGGIGLLWRRRSAAA